MANNAGIPVSTPAGTFPSIAAAWRATKDLVPHPASSIQLVRNRLSKGWPLDQALGFVPPVYRGRPTRSVTVAGVKYPSLRIAAEAQGVEYGALRQRLKRGWTIDEAFGLVERKLTAMTCHSEKELAKHGLTEDDWALLWVAQGGACPVCGTKKSKQWHIDHDRSKGYCKEAVRGILCDRCNKSLSYFQKDATTLNGFLAYAEKYSS